MDTEKQCFHSLHGVWIDGICTEVSASIFSYYATWPTVRCFRYHPYTWNIHENKWLFQLDDSKSLHGKWLLKHFHPLNTGCLEFQIWIYDNLRLEDCVRVEKPSDLPAWLWVWGKEADGSSRQKNVASVYACLLLCSHPFSACWSIELPRFLASLDRWSSKHRGVLSANAASCR